MGLGDVITRLIRDEDAVRLKGGLALRWTDYDEYNGILSISRIGSDPSPTEVDVVVGCMEKSLPPHIVTIDNTIYRENSNNIVRIEVQWIDTSS
jgi:hypothetical protein